MYKATEFNLETNRAYPGLVTYIILKNRYFKIFLATFQEYYNKLTEIE